MKDAELEKVMVEKIFEGVGEEECLGRRTLAAHIIISTPRSISLEISHTIVILSFLGSLYVPGISYVK